MSLFDLLNNAKNKIQGMNLFNRIANNPQPIVEDVQVDVEGNVDPYETLNIKQATTPRTLGQKLFGRSLSYDYQDIDPDGNAKMTTISSFQPGALNNFAAGYNENRLTPFNVNNFGQNAVNGSPKSMGYRIGEGFGTLGRVLDSPLGRGLLTAGIVGLSGGGALPAITFGGMAGALNQGNRNRDAFYRNQLETQGIDTSGIGGYVDDNTFKNILDAKTIQDNAEWRKEFYKNQAEQNKTMNEIRLAQMERQAQQDAISNNIAYGRLANDRRELDLREKQIENVSNNMNLTAADKKQLRENLGTLKDIEAGLKLIEENPNAYSLAKGFLPAWATNRLDPKGISTRAQIDNITAVYRKWLTGAQMSDAERKAYERFLPAPTDNYKTVKAKLEGMYNSIQRKNDVLMQGANMPTMQNNDPLGLDI